MNQSTTISPILSTIQEHRAGQSVGLYSVCCSHPIVLSAAMEVARQYSTPLLIEATSNQVDQFGGYTGMKPAEFYDYVHRLAKEANFPSERLILGGDHLGPNAWQTQTAQVAMTHAQVLIASYVAAGFHKIHLDCSMRCADDIPFINDEIVAERAVQLALIAEQTASHNKQPPPVYVIGTEVPIPGGEASLEQALTVTTPQSAARTLEVHRQAFTKAGMQDAWARIIALVVQPGVDFDQTNVQRYNSAAAATLSTFVEGQAGLVFEAHSTDYQLESDLHKMVRDHYAILKVGPAATFALREGFLALSLIEEELLGAEGHASHLMKVLDEVMVANSRHWQKHYLGSEIKQRLMRRYSLSDRCRYYWGEPKVAAAVNQLLSNLTNYSIPLPLLSQYLPEQFIAISQGKLTAQPQALLKHKVTCVLAQYARACNANSAPKVQH